MDSVVLGSILTVLYIALGLWVARAYIACNWKYTKAEKLCIILACIPFWPPLLLYETWQWLNDN